MVFGCSLHIFCKSGDAGVVIGGVRVDVDNEVLSVVPVDVIVVPVDVIEQLASSAGTHSPSAVLNSKPEGHVSLTGPLSRQSR